MSAVEQREYPPDRPRSVTFVSWGVFFLGVINAFRALSFARQGDLLRQLDIKPAPGLHLALALVWTVLLFGGFIALRVRWRPIRRVLPVSLLIYGIYQLALPLVFARTQLAFQAWPMAALLYLLAVLASIWALNRTAGRVYLSGTVGVEP